MTLSWELLIDADMTEADWQFSAPTTFNLLRIEQENPPEIGRFALGQATASQSEFLDIKAYPARAESTRITLDAVGEETRRIAVRYRYGQFSEGVLSTWRVRVYGSLAQFEPAINPSAVVITLDPRIAGAIPLEEKGLPLGVATLNALGQLVAEQLPDSMEPLNGIMVIRNITLLPNTNTDLLSVNPSRKGYVVRNTGTSTVELTFGMPVLESAELTELYKMLLNPDEAYLHDIPALIPYSAKSLNIAGEVMVYELA